MKAALSLEISSRVLALVSACTMVLTGELHPILTVLALVAIAASFLHLTGEAPRFAPPHPAQSKRPSLRIWNALTLLALLVFILDLLWLADSPLHAAVHLLLYLMAYRLFNLSGPRDHLQLSLVCFLLILISTQYSDAIYLGVCFVVFLLVGAWNLLSIQLRKVIPSGYQPEPVLTPVFFSLTAILSMGTLLFGLAVFFIAPRISGTLFSTKRPEPVRVAGFSDRVEFGSLGPIKLESRIVMRVMVPDQVDLSRFPLYLRGMAFDTFDGLQWLNHGSTREAVRPDRQGGFTLRQGPRRGIPVRQQILLEPLGTPVIFGFSLPHSIGEGPSSVLTDAHGTVYLPAAPTGRIQYAVESRLSTASALDLKAETVSYPDWIVERYLQRPVDDQKIAGLARDVTRGMITVYEKAKAIETHLRRSYRYSLDVKPSPDLSPIEDFLFGQKRGYCEHFATAMVLMLRSVGIPSRLVSGFLPGKWNDYGNYYMIRQSDAHAWVEAYFPHSGWVTFDPTPPSLDPQLPWAGRTAQYIDYLKVRWERYIVNYSFLDQAEALARMKTLTDTLLESYYTGWTAFLEGVRTLAALPGKTLSGLQPHLWALFLFLLITGAAVLVVRMGSWFRARRLLIVRKEDPSAHVYSLMLEILATKGLAKERHLTPLEFLRTLRLPDSDFQRVKEITQIYQECRFGRKRLTLGERRRMEGHLQALMQARSVAN